LNKPVAKAKRRQADVDLLDQQEAEMVKNVVKQEPVKKPRKEVSTAEIVNIMADEIQLLYEEMGDRIDDVNARDKALTLWRELHVHGHVVAQEREIPHALCEKHE
jgi:ribonucleotide reductase alpha subunit